jgi:hypothetical protein
MTGVLLPAIYSEYSKYADIEIRLPCFSMTASFKPVSGAARVGHICENTDVTP